MTGGTWPGVTEEQRNTGVLTLMTGVAYGGDLQVVESTKGAGIGPGSMLPLSMLLPPPMLMCGCVGQVGWVG